MVMHFICPMHSKFLSKIGILFAIGFTLAACSKQFVPTQYQYTKNQIKDEGIADVHISDMIKPYKDSLEKTMSTMIVENEALLSKGQPESTLGNLLADILLEEANRCCGKKVDVAVINNGGIRVPEVGAGWISLGKVYEIMPFENRMALMELSGNELKELLNAIAAAGGWPISGARFVIKNKKAENITIGGVPFDESRNYIIGLSDYLTEGGDNLYMLKGKPVIDGGKNLREAFISGFERVHSKGEKLKSKIDGRIKVEE